MGTQPTSDSREQVPGLLRPVEVAGVERPLVVRRPAQRLEELKAAAAMSGVRQS